MKHVDQESIRSALHTAISKMTLLEMIIFYLRIEKNLTLKQISDKICLSHESVRQNLKKIYTLIRKEIKNESISK